MVTQTLVLKYIRTLSGRTAGNIKLTIGNNKKRFYIFEDIRTAFKLARKEELESQYEYE